MPAGVASPFDVSGAMNTLEGTSVFIGAPVASLPSQPPAGVFDVGKSATSYLYTPARGGRDCATYTESPSTRRLCPVARCTSTLQYFTLRDSNGGNHTIS